MTALAQQPHPVTRVVAAVREQLADVTDVPVWSMGPEETSAALADVVAAEAQLVEVKARLLGHADRVDVKAQRGMPNTAMWLAHQTNTTRPAAHRAMRLADALDRHELTRLALAEGRVLAEQAEVVLAAVDALPDDLDPALLAKAETHLLGEARDRDAKALKLLGQHLMEVIAPDLADAHLAQLLEAEERRAQESTRLVIWDDGHGRTHGRFTVDSAITGALLDKMVTAIAAPRHQASQGPLGDLAERRPTPERKGEAFCELIQRFPVKKLPRLGGLNVALVVTMTLEGLQDGLEAAGVDTGGQISAGLARRLACEAGIIPAVLGGRSELLDLGRSRRLFNTPQRIGWIVEHGGICPIDGCDRPATHAHHWRPWADGGTTDYRDLFGCCPWHHTKLHDPRYELRSTPTGKHTFHRRT